MSRGPMKLWVFKLQAPSAQTTNMPFWGAAAHDGRNHVNDKLGQSSVPVWCAGQDCGDD